MAAGCGESHGGAEKLLSGSTAESAAAAAAAAMAMAMAMAMASIQERKHQAKTRRGQGEQTRRERTERWTARRVTRTDWRAMGCCRRP
ncbi:hypothetical protein IG631_15229 [Alternaria alternata]|nr:hypothetical protein IG631_15229 [Alternaria alternata]